MRRSGGRRGGSHAATAATEAYAQSDTKAYATSDAKAYATEVVKVDFEEAGDEDVYRKVSGDLDARGAEWTEAELREKMASFLAEAKEELMNEVD